MSSAAGPEFEILADDDDKPAPAAAAAGPAPPPAPRPGSVNAAMSAALAAKGTGNSLAAEQQWESAANAYTDALLALPDEDYLLGTRCTLLTNRALCRLQPLAYNLARDDCDAALTLDAESAKAWFRRAQAFRGLGDNKLALRDLKHLLKLQPKNKSAKALARNIIAGLPGPAGEAEKARRRRLKAKKLRQKKKKKAAAGGGGGGGLGLYDDKLSGGASRHARLLERIRQAANAAADTPASGGGGDAQGNIERTFAALLDPKGFRARIFPGLKIPDGFNAPQSLRELLNDPRFDGALESIMPAVLAQADSVISNVKKRAAKSGEIMDAATESQLRPRVLLEAFARQVTKVTAQTSAAFLRNAMQAMARPASAEDERAEWDQLSDPLLAGIGNGGGGMDGGGDSDTDGHKAAMWGTQDGFMDDEWPAAILEDLVRLERSGRLSVADPDMIQPASDGDGGGGVAAARTSAGKSDRQHTFATLGRDECGEDYPALSELIEQLEALPFEINKKWSSSSLKTAAEGRPPQVLAEPGQISCAVSRLPPGVGRRLSVDGLTRGEPNGREISFLYVVSAAAGTTLRLRQRRRPSERNTGEVSTGGDGDKDTDVQDIALVQDRLVAFRSLAVSNEVCVADANTEEEGEAGGGGGAFLVTFFASTCGAVGSSTNQ